MIKYSRLIKSTEAFKLLKAESKNPCHAYFISGSDFLSLSILVKLFLAEVYREEDERADSMAENGTLADVINLPFDKKDKLLTEDINYIIDTLYYTPSSYSKKFYVLNGAETMTVSAQNKLLKTLEEPPRHAHIILTSVQKEMVLPTVLSRCKNVRLEEFTAAALIAELTEYNAPGEKLELACVAANGRLELAEKMLSSDRYLKLMDIAMDTLRYLKKSSEIIHYAYNFNAAKDNLLELIDFLQLILRDVMCYSSGSMDCVLLKSRISEIISLKREYSTEFIVKVQEVFLHAKKRILTNGNTLSIIDQLLFSLLEVKSKCQK